MPQNDWIKNVELVPEKSSYKVDATGRIVIPTHLRKKFGIEVGDKMEYYTAFVNDSWFLCVRLDTPESDDGEADTTHA